MAPNSVRAQPADLEGWLAIDSPYHLLLSNAGPERTTAIAVELEIFRAAFARMAPELEFSPIAPTTIIVFRNAESFAQYKTIRGSRGSRVYGQFLSRPEAGFITLDADARGVGPFEIVYHEYVHYFLRRNFPRLPRWLNEGLAEYYSTFAIEDGAAVIGRPVARHVRAWVDGDWSDEVLDAAIAEPERLDETQRSQPFYSASWALVHYLLSGREDGTARMVDYLSRMLEGEEPNRAFEEAFDLRLHRLSELLREHVLAPEPVVARFSLDGLRGTEMTLRRAAPIEVAVELGALQAHIGDSEAAARHFDVAIDLEPGSAAAQAGLAHVAALEGRLEEASLRYTDAAAAAPLDAADRFRQGRVLLELARITRPSGEALAAALEAARAALAAAIDRFPNYAEAHALHGASYLVAGDSPHLGIASLKRARQLQPGRVDLAINSVRLHLRASEIAPARDLIEHELALLADPDTVEAMRQEVARMEVLLASREAFRREDPELGIQLFDEAISLTADEEIRERMEVQLIALQERYGL